MGSKKNRTRGSSPTNPVTPSPQAAPTKGVPWALVAVAVVVVGGVGAYATLGASDPELSAVAEMARGETPATAPASEPAPASAAAPAPITASGATMPENLDGLPMPPLPYVPQMVPRPVELVKKAYVFAAQNPGVLSYVPCYCGCENNGHVSNVDCFVGSRAPNGAVESWDTHGMT
jgi:hypothetical protein